MNPLKIYYTILFSCSMFVTSCTKVGFKYYKQGENLVNKQEYQKAVDEFSRGIEANDLTKPINHYGRAYAYYQLKDFEKAKKDLKNSLKTKMINSSNVNKGIYWVKALIASEEGDKLSAVKYYEKALYYSPENTQIKTSLGFALIESNEPQKAIVVLNEVIQKNDQDPFAYSNRAWALIQVGELDKAKLDLDASKKLDDQNPFLYKNYFHYYQGKKDSEAACQALDEALKMDMSKYGEPKDREALMQLKGKFCS